MNSDALLPDDATSLKGTRDWPHAPPHRLGAAGVYFVTSRTLEQKPYFHTPERLTMLQDHLLTLAEKYGWRLEAWAVLSNHYHFVAHSPTGETSAASLGKFLRHLHGNVSRQINQADGVQGRQIWQNYRETHLTYQKSYLARLNYVHNNAVHHRLVEVATAYPWCSATAFAKACTPAWVKTVESFRYDQIATEDSDEITTETAKPVECGGLPPLSRASSLASGSGEAEGECRAGKPAEESGGKPPQSKVATVVASPALIVVGWLLLMMGWGQAQSGEGISGAFALDTGATYSLGTGASAAFVLATDFALGLTGAGSSNAFVLNTQPANGAKQPLQVRLLNANTQAPVSGALIQVKRGTTTYATGRSGVTGEYFTQPITPRSYTLELRATGYTTRIKTVSAPASGQGWSTTLDLAPDVPVPNLQAVNQTPPPSALRTSTAPDPQNPLAPRLLVFDPATQDFSSTAPVYLDRMTIIMAHGWNASPNGRADSWPRLLAQSIFANQGLGGNPPNIVAWDWRFDAVRFLPPIDSAVAQGSYLGMALQTTLHADYAQRLHFIGHSLGAIVCKNACDYVHGDFPRSALNPSVPWNRNLTLPHVTLLDEAELATFAGQNVLTASALGWELGGVAGGIIAGVDTAFKDWKSPIPVSAKWLDNYISMVGLQHPEAVNVCLITPAMQLMNPIDAHGYSYQWYRSSITGSPAPAVGWRKAYEAGGIYPPSGFGFTAGSLWYEQPSLFNPMQLLQEPVPGRQECLRTILGTYALKMGASVGQEIRNDTQVVANYVISVGNNVVRKVGEVQTQVTEKVGQGWDAFKDTVSHFSDQVVSETQGSWQLQSLSGLLLKNSEAPAVLARGPNNGGVVSPYAWMTVTLPSDAALLAFDFKVTGDPVEDCVVCAINEQNLFSLPLKFAPDGMMVSTDMMDVSAYAGQNVEIMFGLAGGTSTTAELTVDGLRIISVPAPQLKVQAEGNQVALRWPAAATGWLLEASDNLTAGSWQAISPGAVVTVDNGDIILTETVDRVRRYYRLRRSP